ncbi:MAG: flavin reductase FMN-binding protein [Acidimicrobiales bacterium]|nr:flavin reductase FMN-binding protein [Acidimicrobiales bacterium]
MEELDEVAELAERFNELMGQLDAPMAVVTTVSGDERAGCLVGFHSQCGMEPPGYAIWLSKANHTYQVGALAEVFAVHFLGTADRPTAELFGTETGDRVDKFERCSWTPGPEGVPLLDACPNRVVGRRRAFLDAGTDHACVVLDPIDIGAAHLDGWLGLAAVTDLEAGHDPAERQHAG